MSRLTYKNKRGYFEARGDRTGLSVGYDGSNAVVDGNVVDRLAAYEDIGLEPSEIENIIHNFESFLCEMTGNQMSKPNYTLEAMVSVANDYQQSICDECGDGQELAQYEQLGTVEELSELVKAKQERSKGCEHCRGWDSRCGANYCPMCGKRLEEAK